MIEEFLIYFSIALIIIIINVPFGYLRHGVKKLSFLWFLYIHIPVPFVILIRYIFHIDLSFATAPLLFGSYFLGQVVGQKICSRRIRSTTDV